MVRYDGEDLTLIKGIQDVDVVRDYERVQLQGDIYLVDDVTAKGRWPSLTDNLGRMEKEGSHHRAQEGFE